MSTVSQPLTSSQDRSELILSYLPRVRWIARRIHARLSRAVALEDLVSIGVLGLITAIDRFDPGQNVKLATYADHRIRGAILDSIRSLDGVPAHRRSRMKMIFCATAAAAQKLLAFPDQEQIARELGVSVSEYQQWLSDVRPHSVSSIDGMFMVGPYSVKLADVLADDSELEPDHLLECTELRQLLDRAFSGLPPTHYRVMQLYYREGLRIQEIANILKVHSSRVWQIKNTATARVRDFILGRWNVTRECKAPAAAEPQGRYAAVAD